MDIFSILPKQLSTTMLEEKLANFLEEKTKDSTVQLYEPYIFMNQDTFADFSKLDEFTVESVKNDYGDPLYIWYAYNPTYGYNKKRCWHQKCTIFINNRLSYGYIEIR